MMEINVKIESYAAALAALQSCADVAKSEPIKEKFLAAHKDFRRAFKDALEALGAVGE